MAPPLQVIWRCHLRETERETAQGSWLFSVIIQYPSSSTLYVNKHVSSGTAGFKMINVEEMLLDKKKGFLVCVCASYKA
jgi:hypothetical protein